MREACRALRGRTLRTETYALDGQSVSTNPYAISESRYRVRILQPPTGPSYGSVYPSELESITYHYEREPTDPRIRTTSSSKPTPTGP